MTETNLADAIARLAATRGDQTALRFPRAGAGGTSWSAITFADLHARAERLAGGLAEAGLEPGMRALLMVRPSLDFHPLVFALFRLGVTPIFVDPGMGLRNVLRVVQDLAPDVLVAPPVVHAVSHIVRAPFRDVRIRVTDGGRWFWGGSTLAQCREGHALVEPPPVDADALAVIVSTSGSTGPAKGVALSHRTMSARVSQIQSLFGFEPGTTVVETLLVYTVLELCMGLTVVIPRMDLSKPATVDPAELMAAVRAFSPTTLSDSPVVWHRLADHLDATDQRLDGVRVMLTTAAPIPVRLHARLRDRVDPGTELFTPYGATEAMPVSRIGSKEILDGTAAGTAAGLGTCVGLPAPGMEVRIIRLTDAPIPAWSDELLVTDGDVGEIVVRGDGVSPGYVSRPDADADARIPDPAGDWHRMGDLGHLDAVGRLWFVGRKAHRVETADGLIPAVAVEGVFNQHPAVARTALVGLGPRGNEQPVLAVELLPGHAWSDALAGDIAACADGTRWHGRVRRLLPHPGFPTDARHNSKIRREEVRAWAEGRAVDLVRAGHGG